jgi:ribosomal protein S18 acetylase RimI-like enzyme
MNLIQRKAKIDDLKDIVSLLVQDELGENREQQLDELDQLYIDAFRKINTDPNQYLMVVELEDKIVGTCHFTIIPSLTFIGSTRMQIEAVRIHANFRGQQIGEWMINEAIDYGKNQGAKIIQLTTNKQRKDALRFYENLGFKATHEGMKLYLGC